MAMGNVVSVLAALLVIGAGDSQEGHNRWCERVCSRSRQECPAPCAPIPPCPSHTLNLSCPEIPPCPSHVVNLSCPEPRIANPPCPSSPCPSCPACPNTSTALGYEYFPGIGSYKFYCTRSTWLQANQTCSVDGGYLAIPDTKMEYDVIMKIVKLHKTDAYIGFHDFNDEGNFRTSIGDRMNVFQQTLWVQGQPDGGSAQNGVYMETDGRIRDYDNNGEEEFVCEMQ